MATLLFNYLPPTIALARPAPLLKVISPQSNQQISGNYTFVAAIRHQARFATLEFDIGSNRIGFFHCVSAGSTNRNRCTGTFNVNWNTGYASDGSYELQVIGRNAAGKITASAEQIFTIDNHGNSLQVMSPDLTKPLTGVVPLSVHGSDSQYYPALWVVNIDGHDVSDVWTDNLGEYAPDVTTTFDTRAYANGTHELYIGMYSDFWQGDKQNKSWHNWRGGFERVVTFANGHAPMGIAANYLHVYLRPGESVALSCRTLFTDGSDGPCASPMYSSSSSAVAFVSNAGMISAGADEGFATITLTDAGVSTKVYVWVKRNLGVPHFAGNGQLLDHYTPGSSLFVIAPFVLQPSDLESDPSLEQAVKQAGVNTLSRGFYVNPRNVQASFAGWKQFYDAYIAPDWNFARYNGFHILATGDEVCRNIGGEAWWTLNWPAGKAAVQYAFEKLAASGVAISVDMVDEANMLWGSTPTPPGNVGSSRSFTSVSCSGDNCTVFWPNNPVNNSRFPSGVSFALGGSENSALDTPAGQMFTAANITGDSFDFTPAQYADGDFTAENDPSLKFLWWAGNIGGCPNQPCTPPVPNDALLQIANWLHEAQPTVPISWPTLGASPPSVVANWMGPGSISDYASQYWTSLKLRSTYTWSSGIQEENYWMRQAFYQRQPVIMLDRPQLLLGSISGPAYTKETSGAAYYTPPNDVLNVPGVKGPVITSTMMTAAALGAAGLRLYQFDEPSNAGARATAPIGASFQTGANPVADDAIVKQNWQSMAYGATALNLLAPYILGTELSSPAYGDNIVTAARQGPNGRMLMIVNDNDWQRTITVDCAPYAYGGKTMLYRISSDGITSKVSRRCKVENITLAPGETAAYVLLQK